MATESWQTALSKCKMFPLVSFVTTFQSEMRGCKQSWPPWNFQAQAQVGLGRRGGRGVRTSINWQWSFQ